MSQNKNDNKKKLTTRESKIYQFEKKSLLNNQPG